MFDFDINTALQTRKTVQIMFSFFRRDMIQQGNIKKL